MLLFLEDVFSVIFQPKLTRDVLGGIKMFSWW